MCLIIDTNAFYKVFPSPDVDHEPVRRALLRHKATLVYGGELRREYLKSKKVRAILRRLDQSGIAKLFPDNEIDAKTKAIAGAGGYHSDDPHILALAIVSGARLLCSDDEALSSDFKNKKLIDQPRGSVYREAKHVHLLSKHCG